MSDPSPLRRSPLRPYRTLTVRLQELGLTGDDLFRFLDRFEPASSDHAVLLEALCGNHSHLAAAQMLHEAGGPLLTDHAVKMTERSLLQQIRDLLQNEAAEGEQPDGALSFFRTVQPDVPLPTLRRATEADLEAVEDFFEIDEARLYRPHQHASGWSQFGVTAATDLGLTGTCLLETTHAMINAQSFFNLYLCVHPDLGLARATLGLIGQDGIQVERRLPETMTRWLTRSLLGLSTHHGTPDDRTSLDAHSNGLGRR